MKTDKRFLVVSANSDDTDILLEFTSKTREEAEKYLKDAVIHLLIQFVENGYGESEDDFEYGIEKNDGWASDGSTTYYYKILSLNI